MKIFGSGKAKYKDEGLYSLIQPVIEANFKTYGEPPGTNIYRKEMRKLRKGEPQKILQEYPLARQIVWALLSEERWVRVLCEKWAFEKESVFFDGVKKETLENTLDALRKGGLLDMVGDCFSSSYCFASELITEMSKGTFWNPPSVKGFEYRVNEELREALIKFLQPYESEKRQYQLPKKS